MRFQRRIHETIASEAQLKAGHDFEVEKSPLLYKGAFEVPDKVAIINTLTNDYLGTVGKGWEPVQPTTLYEMAQELLNASEGSYINETINMLGGSVIGIGFKLAEREYIEGDPISLRFLMLTSFNGMYGISGTASIHRIINDTYANTSSKVFNLKHTRFVSDRLRVVTDMLKYYHTEINKFDNKMRELINHTMDEDRAIRWFQNLFPAANSARSQKILDRQTEQFGSCLLVRNGAQIHGVQRTAYGAWMALTDYVNNLRTVRVHNNRDADEVTFQSIHFGTGNQLIQKGMDRLMDGFFSQDEFLID